LSSEEQARVEIDRLLTAAGWTVTNATDANIHASRGVAIREFPLPGHGYADYLLYLDGKAAGVVEAKKRGVTLTGVEIQAARYVAGLPASLPAWMRPLPYAYQSTGVETRFTNGQDPDARSRPVFAFHRPEALLAWLTLAPIAVPGEDQGPGVVHTQVADAPARPFAASCCTNATCTLCCACPRACSMRRA